MIKGRRRMHKKGGLWSHTIMGKKADAKKEGCAPRMIKGRRRMHKKTALR